MLRYNSPEMDASIAGRWPSRWQKGFNHAWGVATTSALLVVGICSCAVIVGIQGILNTNARRIKPQIRRGYRCVLLSREFAGQVGLQAVFSDFERLQHSLRFVH